MAGPIPRATMAGNGQVVHLVSHVRHEDWAPQTLCTEEVDRQRDPVPVRGCASVAS